MTRNCKKNYVHSNIRICITFTYSYMYIPPRPDKLNTCSNTPQYTHSVSWMLALTEYPKNTYSISWILNVEVDFKPAWVGQKAALPWDIELHPLFSGLICSLYGHIPIVEYVYFGLSYSHIRIKEYDIYVAKCTKRVAFVLVNRSNKCICGFRKWAADIQFFEYVHGHVIWQLEPDWTKGLAFHMFKIDPLVGGRSIVWKPYITVNQHLIWQIRSTENLDHLTTV